VSAGELEKERLIKLKKMRGLETAGGEGIGSDEEKTKEKRKKTKGVNPLAAKKKKKKRHETGGAFGKQTDQSKVCQVLFYCWCCDQPLWSYYLISYIILLVPLKKFLWVKN